MKKQIVYMLLGVLLGCLMATDGMSQKASSSGFDKLKKLEGEWKGVKSDGNTVEVSYKLMSNGSAMVETLTSEEEPSMVTVYHQDGDKLMMTHYCAAGNQPRMKATVTEEGDMDFQFVDVTNLKSKAEGHMKGLRIDFVDENHFNQIWTWKEGDQTKPNTFKFERNL